MPGNTTESRAIHDSVRPGLPRVVELVIATTSLLVCLPIMGIAAVAIAVSSGLPILFPQERVGSKGRRFVIYKLRTMRCSTGGPAVTAADDRRVTTIGRFLRKIKLDEVPQLWNVLTGDMSLVGPRPEVARYVDEDDDLWRFVLQAKPGIVDPVTLRLRNEEELLAQVDGNREEFYLGFLRPFKLRGYQEYLRKRSAIGDLKVLVATVIAVLLPRRFPAPGLDEIVESVAASDSLATISVSEKDLSRNPGQRPASRIVIRQLQHALDVIVLAMSFVLAYLLRFDFGIPAEEFRNASVQLPVVVTIQFVVLCMTGIYSFVWRYVGMAELRAFLKAALLACLPVIACRLALPMELKRFHVPLSVSLMDTVFAFGGVLAIRIARRAIHEASIRRRGISVSHASPKKAVLLIGAGRAGMIAAREIIDVGSSNLEIKGFIDDDPNKQGSVIQGIKVLGTTQDLPALVGSYHIDHVVISIAKATRRDFRRILDICERISVKVRVIPGIYEILLGNVKISRIRDLQIEDLLGREPVHLDEAQMERFLVGKTVMVTGAGGSIGSELARQVARFDPGKLLLVERAEFALFDADRALGRQFPDLSKVSLVADISDQARMRSVFAAHRPHVVFHAAAHKHVPMMESNVSEAVKNNVLATRLLGEMAAEYGVGVFVMVSTDKAVRPTSVMGATKRVAELVVQDLDQKNETNYVAVRFGNVIGSAGSVIPIFREQIMNGGPVTVTHPEMTRYFMTIPEAAQLVLQAGAMGQGGEIFILDMGEPVRILDLAKEAILLSGLRPYDDIDIVFTGVRPGEKLCEELEATEEQISRTCHPKIFIGKIAACPSSQLGEALSNLELLSTIGDDVELRRFIGGFLPEAQIDRKRKDIHKPEGQLAFVVSPEG